MCLTETHLLIDAPYRVWRTRQTPPSSRLGALATAPALGAESGHEQRGSTMRRSARLVAERVHVRQAQRAMARDQAALDQIFHERLHDPRSWLSVATRMLVSAGLLEPYVNDHWRTDLGSLDNECPGPTSRSDVQLVHFMLVAMALENLFKAAIVRDLSGTTDSGIHTTKLPSDLKSHDLIQLAKRAGYSPRADDEELIVRLSAASVWHGRYPIPLSAADWGARTTSTGDVAAPGMCGSIDPGRQRGLLRHAASKLGLSLEVPEQ